MKKVFRNSGEVSHRWANKLQAEGRCRNAFFDGDTYYSYGRHYVIGCHLPDGSVAINLEENSATTNSHVREAIYAVKPRKVLRVFNPGGEPDYAKTERHVQHFIEKAAAAKPNGNRPRYLAHAQQVADDYNAFCAALGLTGNPNFPPVNATTDEAELERMRKLQREYAAEERAREKARAAQALIAQAERIAAWRNGEGYASHAWGTLLRLKNEMSMAGHMLQQVQTSRGAEIPVEDAKRLWPVILRVMKGDEPVVRMRLGQYQLSEIRRNGSIVVGCHDVSYQEILGIAQALGLVTEEPVQA